MSMRWAGFGGFTQGLAGGLGLGLQIHKMAKDDERQKIYAEGIAEAKAMREKDIAKSVVDNGDGTQTGQQAPDTADVQTHAVQMPPATTAPASAAAPAPVAPTAPVGPAGGISAGPAAPQQPMPGPAAPTELPPIEVKPAAVPDQPVAAQGIKRFRVGDQGFDTREQALAAAGKKAPSVTDYFLKTGVPKMQEWYIANGDIENAERLGQYIESKRGQAAVKQFGKAMQKLMFTNDVNGGVKALGDYYNDHIDDGVDFTKGEVGPDGKINITVKNKANGTESQMSLSKSELVRMGMAHDPAQLFKMGLAQVEAQEKTAAEIAKERRQEAAEIRKEGRADQREIAKEGRAEVRDIAKEGRASDTRMKEKAAEVKLDASKPGETGRKIRDLREFGWSDERIGQFLDKDGEFKKTTNPTERRALVVSDLTKNNPRFANAKPEEQEKLVNQQMKLIYGEQSSTPAAKGGGSTPGSSGFVRDKVTGKIGRLEGEKFVPVN